MEGMFSRWYIMTGIKAARHISRRGSATVEAAIVLPVFLCMLFSVIFFIKAVRDYEIMQHCISQSALEISQLSYLLEISGTKDIHDSVRDGIKANTGVLSEKSEAFSEALDSLKIFGDIYSGEKGGPAENITDALSGTQAIVNNLKELIDSGGEIIASPDSVLKGMLSLLAEGKFEDLKTELFAPLVKLYLNKYLTAGEKGPVHEKLVRMNIEGGSKGLDLSQSTFFDDQNEDIEIVVRYKLKLPIPFNFFGKPMIVQRAVVRGWLGGSGSDDGPGSGECDYIWQLDNFQRGRALRNIFDANLPINFPVISGFESGKVFLIKSMDLTAPSYQQPEAVEEQIIEYIDRISSYQGQEEPWGSSGIQIHKDEIRQKELIIVIPENELITSVEDVLKRCAIYSTQKAVIFKIQRYGRKNLESD
jgi:hypothetical protein